MKITLEVSAQTYDHFSTWIGSRIGPTPVVEYVMERALMVCGRALAERATDPEGGLRRSILTELFGEGG